MLVSNYAAKIAALCFLAVSSQSLAQSPSEKEQIFDLFWQPSTKDAEGTKDIVGMHKMSSDQATQNPSLAQQIQAKLDQNPYSVTPGYYSRVRCASGICEAVIIVPPTTALGDGTAVYDKLIENGRNIKNLVPNYIIANGKIKTVGIGVGLYYTY